MSNGPRLTFLGRFMIFLVIAGCLGLAYHFLLGPRLSRPGPAPAASGGGDTGTPAGSNASLRIGIAYGTEKKLWLEWAVREYGKTRAGSKVQIDLLPLGSLESAQALLSGDKRIQVWSPASALYKENFVGDWTVKQSGNAILKEEALALTPMVFVMWDERYRAFMQKYGKVSFETIRQALGEKGGWQAIAGKPEWGLFKFGHTHPNQSNSGLMTLVLMAYEYHHKTRGLELADILDVNCQSWMSEIERGVTGLSNSTGNMMREMILKGPSTFDVLFVYESVAIDYLKNAEGRWGSLRVIYPESNMWNDNPYYIIDAPWSDASQRAAAQTFLDYLLTEPVQEQALVHGFRPGNPAVPIKTPTSPFTMFVASGLRVDLGTVCEPPRAEVLSNLLSSWQRQHAP